MAEKSGSRREMLVVQAINPVDGKPCDVQISFRRLHSIAARSIGQLKEASETVPYVLQHPTAIFEGLRREEDDDKWGCGWRCYCGVPANSFQIDGTEGPPYRWQVFLVFVNDETVVYNWRWEKADPDDLKLPVSYQDRFRSQLL